MEKKKIWDVTLYVRLSRDDGDKEESNSVAGQKQLLQDYMRTRPDLREYAVRVDDGYTGSNFDRPAFQAMLEDVKAGRTNCIIVKDLSRFGRNYLDAGEYIEKIFPFLGVRFIAVNDHYDSENSRAETDELVIPFKNLINEAYCRDISVKTRSQLAVKRKQGDFVGAFAVYGYLKDPRDNNRLIVDAYAADVIRDIFRQKLAGASPLEIARRLNAAGILSPLEYKRSLGLKCYTPFQVYRQALWSAVAVLRVLKNPVYIGTLIQGKFTTPSYKVKKQISQPPDQWAIVEQNHEPIIDRNAFDCVQKVLAMDTRAAPGQSVAPLFGGLIFCGECGESMVRKMVPGGGKRYIYYVCSANKKRRECSTHSIRDTVLEDVVLRAITQYIQSVVALQTILDRMDNALITTAQAQKIQRQADKKLGEIVRLQKWRASLYENRTTGLLDQDEYLMLKQSYAAQCATAERQLAQIRAEWETVVENGGRNRQWMEEFKQNRNFTRLDRVAVVLLIDHIFVYRNRRLEVAYRWRDEFAAAAEILEAARPPAGAAAAQAVF